AGVTGGRAPEQFLPAPPPVQLIGMLDHVPCLVAEDPHAFRERTALHLSDFPALQLHQPGVSAIEGNGNAGCAVRTEPLIRESGMGSDRETPLVQFVVELIKAAIKPRALDLDLKVLEAHLKELVVRQGGPSKPARHRTTREWKSVPG